MIRFHATQSPLLNPDQYTSALTQAVARSRPHPADDYVIVAVYGRGGSWLKLDVPRSHLSKFVHNLASEDLVEEVRLGPETTLNRDGGLLAYRKPEVTTGIDEAALASIVEGAP